MRFWAIAAFGPALGTVAPASAAVAQDVPNAHGLAPGPHAEAMATVAALSSESTARFTNWVVTSRDNGELPFMVVDKVAAQVFVFDPAGQLLGATPALLGITPGDDSTPGVGDRELSEISPEDRTTPAGRFVASVGFASGNRKVLWVDYSTSISLHPVVTTRKKERRLQRLKSPSAEDNRITYGCINVPTAFYATVVRPLFEGSTGVVYILPEIKPLSEVFLAFRSQGEGGALPPASH